MKKLKLYRRVTGLVLITLLFSGFSVEYPNILIIGDSISIGYFPYVKGTLEGKANVFHNKGNAEHTGTGIEKLQDWLEDGDWDIITFNWGLWDLCYRNPESTEQGHRDKINGTITSTPEEYGRNIQILINKLKSTGAKLILLIRPIFRKMKRGVFRVMKTNTMILRSNSWLKTEYRIVI